SRWSTGRVAVPALYRLQNGRDFFVGIGMDFQELADDRVGVEANGLRVGAQVRAPEDAPRPLRDVVTFQRLEKRELDLCLFSDRRERDPLLLARGPESNAEIWTHGTPT